MNGPVQFLRHVLRHPYALLPGAPRGIINCARDWVAEQCKTAPSDIRRGPPAAWWEIDEATLRSLPAPHATEPSEAHRPLRIFPTPGTALCFLKGARVLGSDGLVISPDNRVFAEFTYVDEAGGVDHHSVFRRRRFPAARFLPGWYATICYPSSFAYYHWVVESLPRLRLLEPHLDALDGIFVPADLPRSMVDSLRLLGVREDQLVPTGMQQHFAPEHLLVPRYCAGLDIPPWVPEYLRAKILPARAKQPGSRRIYVSRAGVRRRRIVNEDAVMDLLKRHDFEIVHPQDLSFREQAELFASASVVVGPSGAALANAVFCPPGGALVTLQPHPKMGPHVFYSLACAAGLDYWDLAGRPHLAPGEPLSEHVDFEIDVAALDRTVRAVVGGHSPQSQEQP